MRDKLTIFAIIIGLLVLGVFGWGYFDAKSRSKHAEDLVAQLQGRLTENEVAFLKADKDLGMAQARIASLADLRGEYAKLASSKDADIRRLTDSLSEFQRTYKTHVDSLTKANLRLQDVIRSGSGVVTPMPAGPGDPPILSYDYKDGQGRFHLEDPDIMITGNETLTVDQHFTLTAVVVRQDKGNLKAQQIILQEVVKDGADWKSIGTAKLMDAQFTYAPDPDRVKEDPWFDPHVILEVGSTFRSDAPLNVGVGATLLQFSDFGLAATLYSDFESLPGTGLGGQLFWRPRLNDRPFNVGLAAGAGLGVDMSVRPYVGAFFVIY